MVDVLLVLGVWLWIAVASFLAAALMAPRHPGGYSAGPVVDLDNIPAPSILRGERDNA